MRKRPPKPPPQHLGQSESINVPDDLRRYERFVAWKWNWSDEKGYWDKPPINPGTGAPTDATDQTAWMQIGDAAKAAKKHGDGIGFALGKPPAANGNKDGRFVCIDLDDVIREDGTLDRWAAEIVKRLDSYTEITPSGTGLHIWVIGTLPKQANGKARCRTSKRPGLEFYESDRYITITGKRYTQNRKIENRNKELAKLHAEIFPPKAASKPKRPPKGDTEGVSSFTNGPRQATSPADFSDDELIRFAGDSRNGGKFTRLWYGSTADYAGDESAADLGLMCMLAFWTGKDASRMERMFGRSALADRDKWKERPDYREMTVGKAIELTNESFDPSQSSQTNKEDGPNGGFAGFAGSRSQETPNFEDDPRPLSPDLLPVPELVHEMIPEAFRPYLVDIAERGSFPLMYVAAAFIVVVSSLIGRKLGIRPKRHDHWTVVPNLWGALVGHPGIQKTPAASEALTMLRRLVADAMKAHEEAVRAFESDKMIREARAFAAKDELKKAAKSKASDEEMRRLAAEASATEDVEPPKLKRYMVNDPTTEKLGELLQENETGLLLFRDELVGFFRSMDRQGHEGDRAFYLESWNGTESFTYDRIGRGTVHIPALCVSILGTIQPGPLARYLKVAASGEDADGFMPRFQILVYPDTAAEFVNVDRKPNLPAKDKAFAVFQAIDRLNPQIRGCQVDEKTGIPFIGFDDKAQEFFDRWRCDLENRLRSGEDNTLIVSHLAKYRSLLPSLALLFHVVEVVEKHGMPPVSLKATMNAAAWCEVLEAHARRVYQAALDGDPDAAARLAERIKQSLPNPFTFRVVAKKGWSGLDTNDDVRRAVDILEDRGWVKVVEVPAGPSGGRPSEQVYIHPKLLGVRIAGEGAA